ncbi:MAG: hypothetical protein OEZ43_16225 [Gammaproteobacteria bacterium]|nr:hypothetical protein [Gammaproteobacteria bacterium]
MARPSDQWVVAQSTTRMKKSWKILLWLAYSFRTKPVFPIENIKPVLNAIVSEVFDAIKADNHKNFEDAVGELEEWASDIICTTAYTRPNGEKSSWLLLGRDAFGGVSLLRQLSIEYYEMSKAIRVNTRDYSKYLRTLSYFHLNIFGSLWEHMAPVLITEKINDHYRMWSTVVDPIGFKGRDRLSREIIESHERSLSVFVGAWEHWGRLLPKQPKAWEDCKKISEPFMTHLRDTAFMIVDSLRVGDKMASNWAADMLVYWYESAFIGREANTFMYSGAFISYTILGIDQGNRTREFGQHDGELAADVAMNLAIRNAWFDVRLIVATYVLKRARDNGEDVVDLIKALVENNRLLPSGAFGRHQNGVASGKSIVEAYIHQRWTGRGDGTRYTNWLDGFVERLGEIEETPRVIGRVYSSRGADSIWSLREMYRVLAVYYSGLEWRLSSSMRAYLLSDLFGFEKRRDLLVELDWLMSIEAQELAHYDYLIENNDSLKLRLQNYKTSIDKLSAEIRNTNEQELATGEYDNNRLITFGKLASSGVFSRDSGPVPLTLFREIRFVQSLDESFRRKCSIANYPKSDLVTNITVTRAVNDEDWVRDFFRGVLEEMLYRAMLGGINFEEVAEESIHGIVKSLVQRSRDISNQGDTPVLFVGHRDLDNMLDRALFGSESELDASLVVRKNDGYPSRYICHLDSIEIYRMPPGGVEHSLLLPKSSFKTLDVQEFDQNRYVDVQPQPVVSDANEVTLEFVFFMKPEFLQGDSYRFVMNNSNSS